MKCKTRYCRKDRLLGRTLCSSCKDRLYQKRHPIRRKFNIDKQNAKRRGKKFSLTFEEYSEWVREVNLLTAKGKCKGSYTIDRVRNEKGYTKDNIQKLKRVENSSKGTKTLVYDYQTKKGYYIDTTINDINNSAPF